MSIIESIEDGYYELDLAGHITFFNEAFRMIYGYSRDELTGMNALKLADEENAKKAYQHFNNAYTTGTPLKRFEGEIIRKDGGKRHVEASVSLIKNLKGEPIGFRGILRDVTEYRQMVELYKTMAENSLAAFFIVQDGTFRFINASSIANLGYTAEDLIGQSSDIMIHPEDKVMVMKKSRAMLRGKDTNPYEFRTFTKNGQIRWLMQIVSPVQYEGKPAILGNAIDITERKMTEGTVKWLAFHDVLTGLPNRRLFIDRLAMALAHIRRNRKKLSVLMLDLDKF
ncbi:MAG: GGDEF domain-containing protein, partial [Syntrophales bacterium LBB04]|nr:GGDEF domain-containing protein [Syntrophales bacterium LBB04]